MAKKEKKRLADEVEDDSDEHEMEMIMVAADEEDDKEEGNRQPHLSSKDDKGSNQGDDHNDFHSDNYIEKQQPHAEEPGGFSDGRYRNKQRCLILCSRGITARFRHLLEDLRTLVPHHKKEAKLDPGHDGISRAISDISEMRGCNSVLFLECRKRQDAYLWMGKQAKGPSVRFHVSNIHTMDELKMTGNCMKGSRPILSFDESFTRLGHLKLMKELFIDIFGTPRGHPKSKPFVDRVMAFYFADKKVILFFSLCLK